MENKNQEATAKKEWDKPELKTWGPVAGVTQTWRCYHGHRYPCPICTPKDCGTS